MKTRSIVAPMLALGVLFAFENVAQAFPGSAVGTGNSCASCHSSDGGSNPVQPTNDPASDRVDALEILGEALLDLGDGNRNDGKDRGSLQVFTVQPGGTVDLTMQVLDGADKYAVQLKRLEKAGVLGPADTDFLTGFVPDVSWFAQGVPNTYYTSVPFSTSWAVVSPSGPDPYTFSLTVDPGTPLNVYDLEFAVAGHQNVRFYDDLHFYLNVVPEPNTLALLAVAGMGICYLRRRP
ncbi:MAG: PEP-CTERM sorting domain-containing protein [Planctomycetes bacterium]|nr:PEP-CTERM sorting domain-containing protein [Planctomycetota bacterium]